MNIETAEGCRELAKEILGENEGAGVDVGTLLLLSASVGPDLEKLCRMTGIDPAFVRTVGVRLAANGIWASDGLVHANWDDEETGTIEFLCHVNVGLGFMEAHEEEA